MFLKQKQIKTVNNKENYLNKNFRIESSILNYNKNQLTILKIKTLQSVFLLSEYNIFDDKKLLSLNKSLKNIKILFLLNIKKQYLYVLKDIFKNILNANLKI